MDNKIQNNHISIEKCNQNLPKAENQPENEVNLEQPLDSVTIGENTYEFDPDVVAYRMLKSKEGQELQDKFRKAFELLNNQDN